MVFRTALTCCLPRRKKSNVELKIEDSATQFSAKELSFRIQSLIVRHIKKLKEVEISEIHKLCRERYENQCELTEALVQDQLESFQEREWILLQDLKVI